MNEESAVKNEILFDNFLYGMWSCQCQSFTRKFLKKIIFLEFEKIKNIVPELRNKNCKRKCTACYIDRHIRKPDFRLPESNKVYEKATPTG